MTEKSWVTMLNEKNDSWVYSTAAAAAKSLQSCPTLCDPIEPTRLPHPWDSPGKNTGVGCHFLLQCMKVKLLSHVRLLATPWTAAHQAPPSMGFSRRQCWSGCHCLLQSIVLAQLFFKHTFRRRIPGNKPCAKRNFLWETGVNLLCACLFWGRFYLESVSQVPSTTCDGNTQEREIDYLSVLRWNRLWNSLSHITKRTA